MAKTAGATSSRVPRSATAGEENIAETLNRLGVQPERVDQLEVAIDEYDKVPDMIDEFVARIVELGPNPFKGM